MADTDCWDAMDIDPSSQPTSPPAPSTLSYPSTISSSPSLDIPPPIHIPLHRCRPRTGSNVSFHASSSSISPVKPLTLRKPRLLYKPPSKPRLKQNPPLPPYHALPEPEFRHASSSYYPSPAQFTLPLEYGDLKNWDEHEYIQRYKFSGFTIAELKASGSWGFDQGTKEERGVKASTLWRKDGVPILGVLGRERWLRQVDEVEIFVSDGKGGKIGGKEKWCMRSNEKLWEKMDPVLRLASALIAKREVGEWHNALFDPSTWKDVTQEAAQDGCPPGPYFQAASFNPIHPLKRNFDPALRRDEILLGLERITTFKLENLGLPYGETRPTFNPPFEPPYTRGDWKLKRIEVALNTEFVAPLMRDDLTICERLYQQFLLARTLGHELIFFAEEEIAETGRSWENATFGGLVSSIRPNEAGKVEGLVLGARVTTWPFWADYGEGKYSGGMTRYRDGSKIFAQDSRHYTWPLNMKYVEYIQQAKFWHSPVSEDQLKVPQILGKCSEPHKINYTVMGKDYFQWMKTHEIPQKALPPTVQVYGDSKQNFRVLQLRANQVATIRAQVYLVADQKFRERNLKALRKQRNTLDKQGLELLKKLENEYLFDEGAPRRHDLLLHKQALDTFDALDEKPTLEIMRRLQKSPHAVVRASATVSLAMMSTSASVSHRKKWCENILAESALVLQTVELSQGDIWEELQRQAHARLRELNMVEMNNAALAAMKFSER